MKINNIILYNFGSYEGKTNFNTKSSEDKTIILIGGKNGAGKTTLFTAMRICLYGYMSMGYKNLNSFYTKAITKLINNNAKMTRPAHAYVSMHIELNNGQGLDNYIITRAWNLSDSFTETFSVSKNTVPLTENEIADFEKYILSLIPPELFNLYFFDGEKIADFFLDEGSSSRIKNAFLTLCGYDTFDIMRRNFKRISSNNPKASPALDEYLASKEELNIAQQQHQELMYRIKECVNHISDCDAAIDALEKDYYQKGGITENEWNQKLYILKDEEKKRETYNALFKKWANDVIPFLMLRNQIQALKSQINNENKSLKYKHFCEVLETEEIYKLLNTKVERVKQVAFHQFGNNTKSILNLSLEQNALVLSQINQVLSFEQDKVAKCKRALKRSLSITAKTRKELENSNITNVQEYMRKRAQLFEEKSSLLVLQVELEKKISIQQEKITQAELKLAKVQSLLENELKKASINDISARAIIMLDKLQSVLYRQQIEKVENFFRKEISTLMRKAHFIDDIYIDNDFNIHIYRTERIEQKKLVEVLSANSEGQIALALGEKAISKVKKIAGTSDFDKVVYYYQHSNLQAVTLPIEIDKSSLSNGEKQIFIMALYHSLVSLCNHEIPFIIDTPFARIDTEHRKNISKYFFSKLNGQVFILSTNEEINSAHVQILNDKIAATYMLENTDNKKTVVVQNSYFEV